MCCIIRLFQQCILLDASMASPDYALCTCTNARIASTVLRAGCMSAEQVV